MNVSTPDSKQLLQSSANAIDVKRIVYHAVTKWHLVVLSLLICLSIAYYKNRYTQKIYPVSASIIVKEKEETNGGAELLYKNTLIDQYRNYLNEPYILRSYPLVARAAEELQFTTSFFLEGRVITTEIYNGIPVKVTAIKTLPKAGSRYYFLILNDQQFSIRRADSEDKKDAVVFNFERPFTFDKRELLVSRIPESSLKENLNVTYLMVLRTPLQVAAEYVGKLNVKWAEKGAGVMNINLVGSNPEKEIDFINSLVRNYQSYDLEKKNQTADRTVTFIKGQLLSISDSLKLFERQLEAFKKTNRTAGDLGVDGQRMYGKVEGLEVQKTELLIKANYFSYLKKYIAESKNLDQIILPSAIGVNDPILSGLINNVINLQLEIKLYLDKEKSINPLVTSRMNRLTELKRDVLESVESLRSTDKIKLDFINKQIAEVEKQIGYLPLAQRQYISIQRNYSLLENLYVYLMQKKAEAEISKAANVSDLVTVNPPMVAGDAIVPKVSQNLMIAAIVGLAIPLLIFILIEYLNTRVQSKDDIEKFTTIPFIGGIGHKRTDVNLEVLNSPKSVIAESFRALRSNLNYFLGKQEKAVFLITSSISGEGKTFTSINLASVFSLSEKRTLIVGADMRKPKLFKDFNASNDVGLSSYLAGIADFETIIQKTKFKNLDLVSGGPVPPNPSELLLGKRMAEFMAAARQQYDYVVIDTPPLAIITDAFPLTEYADHTISLVRQNYTPKELLKTAQDYYATGKLKNISIVFNDVYRYGPGYGYGYGYGYSYGYSYGYGKKGKNGYGYYSE
ncbi:MAG: polysaccharide biosynthesis tyrosine autokinase [Cytophagales bacterium]|nr:polysaccharide biosynthesis tyrosine autokinase [Cytophagales bacterium]